MSEPGKDIDSVGVYLIAVDDFEWKPSASDGGSSQPKEADDDCGRDGEQDSGKDDQKARGQRDGRAVRSERLD
jgi:hypothetical protein